MLNESSRQAKIETYAGEGNIAGLRSMLDTGHTQSEIDTALENAIAFSHINAAEYLLTLGADISGNNYNGPYYAVHNNELEGLKFAIANGVDVNVENGMLLNTGVITAINTRETELLKWLFEHGADPEKLTGQTLKMVADFGTDELKEVIRSATQYR